MLTDQISLAFSIAGTWRGENSDEKLDVLNPANGQVLGRLPLATEADLEEALHAAERGFIHWRAVAPERKASILIKAASLLRERSEHLAMLATIEQGKTLAEARLETLAAAALVEFHAGEAVRTYGRVLPRPAGQSSLILQQPIGPVAAFCAWNFPVMNVVRKISPAVASGCSVIVKPSEETPYCAIEVLRCFLDAGLPPEIAQIVFGVPDTVSRILLTSPVTRKLSFTGSVAVGKHLLRLAADTVMKATMELGGHAPVLVFDDCDIEQTLDLLVAHKFRNAGQVCISPTRFYVHQDIYRRFVDGFAERTRRLKVGNGMASETQMGPLANARRARAVHKMIEQALGAGAKLLAGGNTHEQADEGFFLSPTVMSDVPLDALAMSQEPFGPLALIRPFATIEEAIGEANRLPYGLAAYCFTENGRRQRLLSDTIEAGMIAINTVRLSWPDSPFGGLKDSGYGSEDGPEGITAHQLTKAVHIS